MVTAVDAALGSQGDDPELLRLKTESLVGEGETAAEEDAEEAAEPTPEPAANGAPEPPGEPGARGSVPESPGRTENVVSFETFRKKST